MKKLIAIILVNLLTTIRIIGVFCLLPIYLKYGGVAAAILSIACYLTDLIDGALARKCHVATFFGSGFDGLADKLFSCANLVVLFTITKYAIIPILFELTIIIIQYIKFEKNINVKSSFVGKAKTWVVSLTVITLYLLIDINSLTFLPSSFISYINSIDKMTLYGVVFIPLYIFEILTVYSYLKFLEKYDPKDDIVIPEIDLKLKPATSLKNRFDNFCAFWLNNEFYEKYKDADGLKKIRKVIKESKPK